MTSFVDNQRYDRQIRVWGAEAQSRIQNAKILILNFSGLNVEVVKNLVLAGMSVTIVDSRKVEVVDLQSNFFLTFDDIGRNVAEAVRERVQELNPTVTIKAVDTVVSSLDSSVIHNHDIVLLHGESEQTALKLNELCRSKYPSIKFFWSESFGDEAIFFSDFGPEFQFRKDQPPSNNAGNTGSTNAAPINVEILKFPSLSETLQKSWKTIPSRHVELSPIYIRFCSLIRFRDIHGRNPTASDEKGFFHIVTQLMERNEVDLISTVAPTIPALLVSVEGGMILNSSILGSFLSQEVIKAVSLQGTPGVNVFVYNGKDNSVKCIPII